MLMPIFSNYVAAVGGGGPAALENYTSDELAVTAAEQTFTVTLALSASTDGIIVVFGARGPNTTYGITLNSLTLDGVAGHVIGSVMAASGTRASHISAAYFKASELPGGGAGDYNIVATFSGSVVYPSCDVFEMSNMNQTTPVSNWQANAAEVDNADSTLSTTQAGYEGQFCVLAGVLSGNAVSAATNATYTPSSSVTPDGTHQVGPLYTGVFVGHDAAIDSASENFNIQFTTTSNTFDTVAIASFVVN